MNSPIRHLLLGGAILLTAAARVSARNAAPARAAVTGLASRGVVTGISGAVVIPLSGITTLSLTPTLITPVSKLQSAPLLLTQIPSAAAPADAPRAVAANFLVSASGETILANESASEQIRRLASDSAAEARTPHSASKAWDGTLRRSAISDDAPAVRGTAPLTRLGPGKGVRAAVMTTVAAAGVLAAGAAGAADSSTIEAGLSLGSLALAGLAGLLAFLSPCCLPLIPGYVSFVSGLTRDELTKGADRRVVMKKSLFGAVSFVAGFTVVFTLLGATATALGSFLMAYLPMMTKIAGGFVVLFGLHTMGLLKIPLLYRDARFHGKTGAGLLGAFAMGLAFAFGWTPCIGPILAGILGLAAAQSTVWQGIALLTTFSLGLGIPFIITALSVNTFLSFFAKYKRYIGWGEKAAGAFLVLLGVLIFTNSMQDLLRWMPDFIQNLAI